MPTVSGVSAGVGASVPSRSALYVVAGGVLVLSLASAGAAAAGGAPFEVVVHVEEPAFPYPDYYVTNNGSGMTWHSGCTQLVRIGKKLFASAFEVVPGCAPLNNARWALYERGANGWRLYRRDEKDRTREPSPLATSHAGRLLMSVNPTLAPWVDAPPGFGKVKMANTGGDIHHTWRGGPARPAFLEFDPDEPDREPAHLLPQWQGSPKFSEHSYRAFAADGERGEFILFQNTHYTKSEWALLCKDGRWRAGKLAWKKRTMDTAYTPYHSTHARANYANVMLRNRAAHFIGHSSYNIWNRIDPKKKETWGRGNWGWRMRKLHYAWTPNITTTPIAEWTVLDDTMDDGGTVTLGDSWLAPDGRVHVVWIRDPIHPKLRDLHFPDIKRDTQLCYGICENGKVLKKQVLLAGGETSGPLHPRGRPRLHIMPDYTLYVLYNVRGTTSETRARSGSYAMRVGANGSVSSPVRVPLQNQFRGTFFTATPRAGNRLTAVADLLVPGRLEGKPTMYYACVGFRGPSSPVVTIARKAQRKTALPSPKPAKTADAEAVAAFDGLLRSALAEHLGASGSASVWMWGMRQKLVGIDESGMLSLATSGLTMTVPWKRLSTKDRLSLALVCAESGAPDRHAIAAFYSLVVGDQAEAQKHLAQASEFAEDVRRMFK